MTAHIIRLSIANQRRVSHGRMHIQRTGDGMLDVIHESASGSSFAILRCFAADKRDDAVSFALREMPRYAPCQLGEIDS